jgi:hypothetical protein
LVGEELGEKLVEKYYTKTSWEEYIRWVQKNIDEKYWEKVLFLK